MGPSAVAPVILVVVLVALYLQGCRDEALVHRRWCFVLTPTGREEHARVSRWLERRIVTSRSAYAAALQLSGEAKRNMLDAGVSDLLETAPGLLRLLGNMRHLARQLEAIRPMPPIQPARFQTRRLTAISAAALVVHHFLVAVQERFLFRLLLIRRGLAMVRLALLRQRDRGIYRMAELDREWHDYCALTDEALASFETLLASLTAVPAADRVPRPEPRPRSA